MSKAHFLAASLLIALVTPSLAEEIDLSKATCANYMTGATGAKMSVLFGWLAASAAPSGVLDFDKINREGEDLHRICFANPSMTLKDASQKAFKN